MIFDDLANLKNYNIVSDEVLEFLYGTNVEILQGKYDFADGVGATVSVYYTKNEGDLEAHQKYIDLHMMLKDEERIDFCDIDELSVKVPYDKERDIEFYNDPDVPLSTIYLEPNKFAVFYPYEAHKPQLNYRTSKEVRNVVIKIPWGK
jgi:YhcH/YjgK/YiaL family protein